jgi:PAS domain S-box-containing protein
VSPAARDSIVTVSVPRRLPRFASAAFVVAVAYILTALLGFRTAFVAEQVTTVWAPTGIAEAALLLFGLRLWPAVWIGAFVANAAAHEPLWVATGIASGNTIEAVAVAWALSRFFAFDPSLDRTRDAIAFMCIGVVAAPAISATVGSTFLCTSGLQAWPRYWELWTEWWFGDALGALIVAPVLLTTFRSHGRGDLTRSRVLEATSWIVMAIAGTLVVFGRTMTPVESHSPLAFTIFPFVIAAAVRVGQPATSLVILSTSIVTLSGTVRGFGPFVNNPVHDRFVVAQVFTAVLAGSGLVLAAAIAERRLIERRRAAAYGVGQVLSSAASLADAAPRLLSAIGTSLNWRVGALWLIDATGDGLRCAAVWTTEGTSVPAFTQLSTDMRLPRGVGLPGRVWASGRPAWIDDVVDDENFPRLSVARREGLHGAFGFPVQLREETIGMVEFFNHYVAAPDEDLLATMAAIGAEIGQFIERKRVEVTVAENQSRTRAILDTALDAILTMDDRGMVTEFNPAAERIFGHRREEAVGRELASLIIPASLREAHRHGLQKFLETGEGPFIDRRFETTAVRADGTEFPAEVAITKVPVNPPVFTGFVRDVTDRATAERERRELLTREFGARRQAEEANRAKDEFLATLSHELRTPLNAIVGWTRMLLDGTLDATTQRRALQIIDRNAHTQVQLVEDILDVSRIITGKLSLDIRPVDLGTIVGIVLDSARPAADAKQIRLRSSVVASAREMLADPKRVQQIIWNLVSNGLRFTPQGGTIDVDVVDVTTTVTAIRVTDSGAGITPEFLPHVFERFSQADSSTTREHGGLGLGLAIVRHLVELHGGAVRAESEGPGRGATFIVELPKRPPELSGDAPGAIEAAAAAADDLVLKGCRVLLVEDDLDSHDLLSTILTDAGAIVESAMSVDEAMAALDRTPTDVLLSDIGLAREDGFALIRRVRAREAQGHRRLPAAAVTAYARADDRAHALKAGFDRYVPKPIDRPAILAVVQELWKQR